MLSRRAKHAALVATIVPVLALVGCEGPAGEPGPQGDPGAAGADGVDGIDGLDGQNGDDGQNGADGENGLQGEQGEPGEPCTVAENGNGTFTMSCPDSDPVVFGETEEPAAYVAASATRGGQLYDKFWAVEDAGATEPDTDHAWYPEFGSQSGSTTWRCKECHGWDYLGRDGGYAGGSHYTGIAGLYPPTASLWAAYASIAEGHGYADAGATDADIWDLVKFYREGMVDTAMLLDEDGAFIGDVASGRILFEAGLTGFDEAGTATNTACAVCHGDDGTEEVVDGFDAFVGALSNDNPREFQHKVRFGHPGTDMPAGAAIAASLADVADLSAYAQTLSPVPWEDTDVARGAQLYDKFWAVAGSGASQPADDHPWYPDLGVQSGSTTWRCKECHGWDYVGAEGAYSGGSHFTGIAGLLPATLTRWDAFQSIAQDHGYAEAGLTDEDIWDLVAFYVDGLVDLRFIINADGTFRGDAERGATLYDEGIGGGASCASCHGADGLTEVVDGFEGYPGALSNENPREFQHKARFGHPGSGMVVTYDNGATIQDIADLSAYAQTLPTAP